MRRALLLGNPGEGLRGVDADIATMSALLARYAFTDVATLVGGDRAAILAAIRDLVDRTGPGDAAVLYYSGHGWRVDEFQGLSPADVRQTTAADFRGILSEELSALIDELTEKTANVTVVLDCCHATGITRGDAARPSAVRAMPTPWQVPPAELLAALRARGLGGARRDPETNPLAVRLFACRPDQQAYEDPRAPGGLLTRALAAVLAESDHGELVWEDVGRRVEAWVRAVKPGQHPVVVGPARRYLFALDTRASAGWAACFTRDDTLWIVGGALLDQRPGDRFIALPGVADRPARARLEISAVHHQLARATATSPLPDGASVQQVAWAEPRAAVELLAPPERRARITAALCASGRLTVAPSNAAATTRAAPTNSEASILHAVASTTPGVIDAATRDSTGVIDAATREFTDVAKIAEVVDTPAGLEIRDLAGVAVRSGATLEQTCAVLDRMAQAAALRRLTSVAPLDPELHAVDLEWTLVDPPRPLVAGLTVPSSAHVSATLRSRAVVPLFVTLFAAEADGRISLLTRSQPNGVLLAPDATYRLGEDHLYGVRGAPLCGPSMRPQSGPRPVALVALVLTSPVALGAWETAPAERRLRGGGSSAPQPAAFPAQPVRYSVTTLELTAL